MNTISTWLLNHERMKIIFFSDVRTIVDINEKKKWLSKNQVTNIIKYCYDKDNEIEHTILDKDWFVTFTKYFQYLGFFVPFILSDDYDINGRMKKVTRTWEYWDSLGMQKKMI